MNLGAAETKQYEQHRIFLPTFFEARQFILVYVTRVRHEMQYGCVRNCLQVRFHDDLKSGPDDIPRPFSSPPAPPSSLLVLTIGIFATYLLAKSRTRRPHYSLRDPHFPGDMGSCGLGGRGRWPH